MAALSVESAGVGKKTGHGKSGRSRGGPQTGVGGYAAGDDQRARADFLDADGGAAQQFFDDGVLKGSEQIERGLRSEREKILSRGALRASAGFDLSAEVVVFHPAKHGGFQAAETEIERVAFHAREREFDGVRIAMRRELIDDGAAGIAEAQKFRHFVVSFAGRVVARFAEQPISEALADFEQVRMAAADDQRERGVFDASRQLREPRRGCVLRYGSRR